MCLMIYFILFLWYYIDIIIYVSLLRLQIEKSIFKFIDTLFTPSLLLFNSHLSGINSNFCSHLLYLQNQNCNTPIALVYLVSHMLYA